MIGSDGCYLMKSFLTRLILYWCAFNSLALYLYHANKNYGLSFLGASSPKWYTSFHLLKTPQYCLHLLKKGKNQQSGPNSTGKYYKNSNVMDNICLTSGKNKPTTYLSFLAWIPESLKYQYAPNSTLIANQESIFWHNNQQESNT